MNFEQFQTIHNELQAYGKITIRYTKERHGDIIHKDIYIEKKGNRFFLKKAELNETKNKIENNIEKQEITEESLSSQHAYISTLFSAIELEKTPPKTNWKSFQESTSKFKWLLRFFLLDSQLIGGAVGRIIAYSANKENRHYKTTPSNILAKTLGPLIFPAGSKKPTIDIINRRGFIMIDSVLHKQYKALENYNPNYKELLFEKKPVTMNLRGEEIALETITASNNQVNPENKDHLHIIYFNGNSGCFQQDYQLVAEDLLAYQGKNVPVTAIQFNYPGILNSEGQVEIAQDLIDAGIAQVQALLDQGVPHSKIVLHGVSLGGSISSHVAAHFHQLNKVDNPNEKQTLGGLYVSRTFASTAQVGRDFFNRALGENIFSKIISTVCLPFIKLGTWGSEWDLDTGKAFFSLPKDKRNYAVVISPKAHIKKYKEEHRGSLFQAISNFILGKKIKPVDDEILRRGLHDAWEKKLEGFLIKRGFYGKEARENYSRENSYRKMMVVDLKARTFAPDIDGHAKASYFHRGEEGWENPKNKSVGLLHRGPAKIIERDGKQIKSLPIPKNEAGKVAREEMARMAGFGA